MAKDYEGVMKLRVIVTGATGMVGEGVVHECLQDPDVGEVFVLGRRPSEIVHPKLSEIVVRDLSNLAGVRDQLTGFDACYFCLGVSSVGMSEDAYRKITYDLTMSIAGTLVTVNPHMTFCYVSGTGTDSSEHGRLMWARVKGKTENDLMKLPFKQVFAFRPGLIQPTKGLKRTNKYYKYVMWLLPIIKLLYPSGLISLREIGRAMLSVTRSGYRTPILEVRDIQRAARGEV